MAKGEIKQKTQQYWARVEDASKCKQIREVEAMQGTPRDIKVALSRNKMTSKDRKIDRRNEHIQGN